jgi:putative ABC transport system permease protein
MDFYATAIMLGLGYAAMGLGIFVSLRIFNIPDITTDGSFTLGGAITAVGLVTGAPHPAILAGALTGGALCGMATGMIHTRMRVNPLLAGILVMTALYSVNLSIMGRSNIPLMETNTLMDIVHILPGRDANTWMLFLATTTIVAVVLAWLLRTDFGIAMRATGDNEQMARANGINTNRMKVTGLMLANMLTAFSGYLLVQYQGFSDISMGIGIVISGLAAVMIGEAFSGMLKRSGIGVQILLVIAGGVLFRLLLAGALSFGLNPNYLKLVTALMVLAVLLLTRRKNALS